MVRLETKSTLLTASLKSRNYLNYCRESWDLLQDFSRSRGEESRTEYTVHLATYMYTYPPAPSSPERLFVLMHQHFAINEVIVRLRLLFLWKQLTRSSKWNSRFGFGSKSRQSATNLILQGSFLSLFFVVDSRRVPLASSIS